MKKLLKFFSGYKKEITLGPAFKLIEALFELFVPIVVAYIVDVAIKSEDKKSATLLSGLLALLGILGFIFSVSAQYFCAKASVNFASRVRGALFSHIQKFSFEQLDRVGTPTLLTRMTSDVNQVQTGVNLSLRLLLRSPFVVFGSAVMAFTISPKISIIFLVMIAVLSVVVFGIMLITMPMHKSVQSKLDALTLSAKENLVGVRVIRAFCKEENEIESFNEKNNLFVGAQKKTANVSALTGPLTQVIVNLGIIVLVEHGAVSVNLGLLTQGALIALYNYMSQILVELVKLANLIVTISKSIACAGRISSILDISPENIEGEESLTGNAADVEFDNVSFRYSGASENSLDSISFKVKAGQTVGVLGGTGDGKTTLVNLIPRFYNPTEGRVLINGVDIASVSPISLRQKVGMVFQRATLFSGTVRENLKFGNSDADDEALINALEAAQAYDFIMEKDGGLDAVVEQEGRNFSGGQRQRLTIARALVKAPQILILDDSSSALDYLTESKLRRELLNLSFNPTCFIVSQRASSVMMADIIIVLEDGRAVGIGTHNELMENCNVYREIYESQFGKEEK